MTSTRITSHRWLRGLAAAGALVAAGAAQAGDVRWSIGLHLPLPPLLHHHRPVYAPAPVYAPVPVYAPAPVYGGRYDDGFDGYRDERYVPYARTTRYAPAYAPVYAPPPVIVVRGRHGSPSFRHDGRSHHRYDERPHHRHGDRWHRGHERKHHHDGRW